MNGYGGAIVEDSIAIVALIGINNAKIGGIALITVFGGDPFR